MFDVAFSRRMCCSRVCNAKRYAGLPVASTLTPTSRPGRERLKVSRHAKYAACGPPQPMGMPNRCVDPTTISAPHSPGGVRSVSDRGSAATQSKALFSWTRSARPCQSGTSPSVFGYCTSTPKYFCLSAIFATSPIMRSIPSGSARVARTSSVCG